MRILGAQGRRPSRTFLVPSAMFRFSMPQIIPSAPRTGNQIISIPGIQLVAHAVLDVVVDDEVKLLFREPVMLRQQLVDLVDDGL